MKTAEVREAFLKFFESKEHQRVASSSLIPDNDPTLLFSNAGMNQFKDCFLGNEKRDYTRATTSQKCIRMSGKHNDLENVGVTARHHTFFEMLGNFSFGDYFKQDAISFAYEFVKDVIKLDMSRFWVTIYEDDDEAGKLWQEIGIPAERILKCGEEDNFWSMGDTGPCGPSSELHYYIGNDPNNQSEAEFRKDDGTYLEFWNLVFMQFNREADGNLHPLPKPSVDTGMGLERIVSILNSVPANYDTDCLQGIISTCEKLSGFKYDGSDYTEKNLKEDVDYARDVAMRVIADHSRAISFLITEGVVPSSDGRGYVLRRLIRRAIRHGKVLKFKDNFLKKTTTQVIKLMSSAYPELKEHKDLILRLVDAEESKFNETIDAGLEYLEKEVKQLKAGDVFSGKTAFLLHDTYGFPLDLTEDALKAYKITVNQKEFDAAMEEQKQRGRDDRKSKNISFTSIKLDGPETKFLGYEKLEAEVKLVAFEKNDDGTLSLFFDQTPFYAEAGGQVGDTGKIIIANQELEVLDTQKVQGKYYLHHCSTGKLFEKDIGKAAQLIVDCDKRQQIKLHHSATHLVHAALRKFLGDHVKQAGSRVDNQSLRFDYSHFETPSSETLSEIQDWVNQEIRNNYPVDTKIMSLDDAKKSGAMALFDEKYSDQVRVVEIGPNSLELCGGTHVKASGDIGALIIRHDSSIATGTRRIECIAGSTAIQTVQNLLDQQKKLANLLKSDQDSIFEKVEKSIEQQKSLEKDLEKYKAQATSSEADSLLDNPSVSPSGVKIITATIENADNETLKSLVDKVRVKLGSGVVAIASKTDDDAAIIVTGVTKDLKDQVHAGKILGEALKSLGGKGGGRPDFAQGGINNSNLDSALNKITELIA